MKNKKYYIFELDMRINNIFSILLFVLFLISTLLMYRNNIFVFDIKISLFILLIVFYLFLHEILHSISYVINGASFKKIVYGIMLEKGVLYCLCKQNISKRNILCSTIFPLIFIGFITYLIGIVFNFPILILLSIINISGCSADILSFIYIYKLKNNIEFTEMDNPLYFAIYADYDVSSISHLGINFIESSSMIKRDNLKKINISKISYLIFIILIFILL